MSAQFGLLEDLRGEIHDLQFLQRARADEIVATLQRIESRLSEIEQLLADAEQPPIVSPMLPEVK